MARNNFDSAQIRPTSKDGQAGKFDMLFEGRVYILKQVTKVAPRKWHPSDDSYCDSPGSEWLGCHVFEHFNIPVQETILGTFRGKPAVGCLDFIENGNNQYELVPFKSLIDSNVEHVSNRRTLGLETLIKTLNESPELAVVRNKAIERFWKTTIVDAIICNYDRHPGNWGYLRKRGEWSNTAITALAPVYDCGSTFMPLMSEEAMISYRDDARALSKRVASSPHSNIDINGRPLRYGELLCREESRRGREILLEMVEGIRTLDVAAIAGRAGIFSENEIGFYQCMVEATVQNSIVPAYKKACMEHGILAHELTPYRDMMNADMREWVSLLPPVTPYPNRRSQTRR